MKVGFESDDNLLLSKILSVRGMIILVRSVSQEESKYYPQVYLHECMCKSVGKLYRACRVLLLVIFFMTIIYFQWY